MKDIRILLVDDQTIVRVGIQRLVSQIPGVKVVDEARSGREAIELVQRLSPDIVLMDLEMPDVNGLEVTRQITRDYPTVKVIILSSHSTGQDVLQAVRAGAKGYIPKDSEAEEIGLAINSVERNHTYLSPRVSKNFQSFVRSAGSSPAPTASSSDTAWISASATIR